jgi:hypothetical protein
MDALTVRAAGLSTRLLDADGRMRVLGAADLPALARELAPRRIAVSRAAASGRASAER